MRAELVRIGNSRGIRIPKPPHRAMRARQHRRVARWEWLSRDFSGTAAPPGLGGSIARGWPCSPAI